MHHPIYFPSMGYALPLHYHYHPNFQYVQLDTGCIALQMFLELGEFRIADRI